MPLQIRIRSLTKQKTFTRATADHLLGEVVATMDKQIDDAIDRLRTYPPEKPGSIYVRTGTLGRSWSRTDVRLTRSGLIATVTNDAVDPRGREYSGWVHGDEQGAGQQEQHASTGWPLAAEVLRTGYAQALRKAVRRAL